MKKQFTELIGVFCTLVFFSFLTTTTVQAQPCNGSATSVADEFISNVSFGGFDNPSGVNVANQVTDFTGLGSIGSISPGIPASFDITITNPFAGDDVAIFLDVNGDGDFTPDEQIGVNLDGPVGGLVSVDVTVPAGAELGDQLLRVKMVFATQAALDDPCLGYTWGETEDYLITVEEGSCTPIAVDAFAEDICADGTFNIEVSITDPGDLPIGSFISFVFTVNGDPETEASFPVPVLPLGAYPITVLAGVDAADVINGSFQPGLDPLCFIFQDFESPNTCPPPNDECLEAIVAECGLTYSGNTQNAADIPQGIIDITTDGNFCGTSLTATGVYYEWTAPFNAIVEFNTIGSDYDTKLHVFQTDDCITYTCVAGNDDGAGFPLSLIELSVNQDETYLVYVSGFGSAAGDYNLNIECTELLCSNPELTVVAQDLEGNPLGDCQDFGESYQLAITIGALPDGDPNTDFTVSAGGNSEPLAVPGQEIILGPYDAGTNVTVTALGNQDGLCSSSEAITSTICPPVNDECGEALPLACDGVIDGTTLGAIAWPDANPDQVFCGTFQPSTANGGVWYELTIDALSVVNIDLSGSLYDTKLFLYGGVCGALECIDGDDDGGTGLDSQLELNLDAGTYYVYVSGFGSARGTYTGTVTCTPILCANPEVTVTNVDAEGNEILADCLDLDGSTFSVLVELAGAEGNETYTVSANGEEVVLADGESNTFGPYTPGTNVNVNVVGDQDAQCGFSASTVVPVCPPDNDSPCAAEVIECGGTYLGTNLGASTSSESGNFCDFSSLSGMVFYQLTNPSVDGEVIFSWNTCNPGTDFDTDSHLFDGPCDALSCRPVSGQTTAGGYVDGQLDPITGFSSPDCEDASSVWATGGQVLLGPGETVFLGIDGFGASQGVFELTISCQDLECSPAVTAEAVADSEGTLLDGCVPFGENYFVSVTLDGGSPNESYNVSVNGGDPVVAEANSTVVVGPVQSGFAGNVTVTGVNNAACSGSASVNPDVCPPSNDLPCDAIAIVADGSTNTYSNIGATSDAGEPLPAFLGGSTVWFSVVGPESGRLNLSTCAGEDTNTDFDTTIGLFEAEVCGDYTTYTQVGFNDDNFTVCGAGNRSELELCVTPGTTYLVQVDGFFAGQGVFDLTASAEDGAICDCVLPDLGPGIFTFANTTPVCDGEDQFFDLTFFGPDDLGSQDAMVYTYDWPGNPNPDPITVLVGASEEVTVPELFALETVIDVTVTINAECEEAEGSIYPLAGGVVQDEFACDPDCEGNDGGPAQPGTPCEDGAGTWSDDCECILAPENATCENAIALECNTTVSGTNVASFPIPADIQAAVPGGLTGGLAVFYTITVTETSLVSLETCLDDELGNPITTFDTDLRVMTGDCVNGFAGEATFNEGAGSPGYVDDFDESGFGGPFDCGTTNTFRAGGDFIAEADVTYTIVVSGWSSTQIGDFDLQVTCEPIAAGASIAGTVPNWNNLCSERAVSIDLYQPGSLILEASYEATLASDGTFSVEGVAIGTFDVFVKLDGYLADGFASVALADGENALEVPSPRLGDLNNNNVVNFVDGSAFNNFLTPLPYDPFADYNCDGNVNFVDASALNQTFGVTGDNPPLSIDQE